MELLPFIWRSLMYFSVVGAVLLAVVVGWHRIMIVARNNNRRRKQRGNTAATTIAFFHPYCSAGGGGERVLWKMVQVLGNLVEKGMLIEQVIIYTVDSPSVSYRQDVLKHVQDRFSLKLSQKLKLVFVHLHEHAHLLEPASSFSLLMESIGAMRLAYKALSLTSSSLENSTIPDVFIDTTGCAFTYLPAVILFQCRVLAYVHYPTISTDMLQLVWERRRSGAYNHQAYISASAVTTYIKLIYYLLFAVLYGAVGSLSSLVLVNSTWTYNHVRSLWKGAAWRRRIRIVFPPCSLAADASSSFAAAGNITTSDDKLRQPVVLSIGQFRPEKDHALQIESIAKLLELHPELKAVAAATTKLVLIGSCRGASDEARLQQLRELCARLQMTQHVEFVVNQPFSVVQDWLHKASVGIHTMWNEHFGIGIVEMMAAGLIVIANNSGGPKSDIVVPFNDEQQRANSGGDGATSAVARLTTTGFLASSVDEYAGFMYRALTLDPKEAAAIRRNARASAKRFTDEVFAESFEKAILELKIV